MPAATSNLLIEISPSQTTFPTTSPIANSIPKSTIHRSRSSPNLNEPFPKFLLILFILFIFVHLPIFLYELKGSPRKAYLDVKHRIGNAGVKYRLTPVQRLLLLATLSTRNTSSRTRIELITEVAAGTGTHQIGVVRRRTDADSFSCPSKQVA